MKLKPTLIKLHWHFASQFGLDLQRFPALAARPARVPARLGRIPQNYAGKMKLMPCLHDRYEEGGATKSEYFWQDLLVARAIHATKPVRHVDIGSRVDGFVAQVALPHCQSLRGAIAIRSRACMPSDTWAGPRSIRLVISAAPPTWRTLNIHEEVWNESRPENN